MAASKPTAIHYWLMVFVVLAIGFGITTYMFQREYSDALVKLQKAEGDLSTEKRLSKNLDDDVQALKNVLGIRLEVVEDRQNPNNPTTVVGATRLAMQNYGMEQAGTTVEDTLKTMREAINTTLADRTALKTQFDMQTAELLALRTRYTQTADEHDNAKKKAETDLRTVTGTQDEKLNAKDAQIAQLRQERNNVETELAEERAARTKERQKLEAEKGRLELINDSLRERLERIETVSFEVPDGQITRVENAVKLVWINLGSSDFLRERMTFSIYEKNVAGVGRGPEDVKGTIEVTRVVGPNSAEARITSSDLYRPIAPGDLIYTPMWSPGRSEAFSFVGLIDLDGDGRDDRDQLHNIVGSAGAVIDNEVDDKGNWILEDGRKEGKISEATKFLVRGKLPDPAELVNKDEIAAALEINKKWEDLSNQAKQYGVRIVTLNDFLSYVGYKARRRLFLPGQAAPYTLRAGAASSSTNEELGGRESSGAVSGRFSPNQTLPPATSTGTTSKLFGGSK